MTLAITIFVVCVLLPIAMAWWLWITEPSPLAASAGICTGVVSAVIAIVWAAGAPWEYALITLALLGAASLFQRVNWAMFDLIDKRRR